MKHLLKTIFLITLITFTSCKTTYKALQLKTLISEENQPFLDSITKVNIGLDTLVIDTTTTTRIYGPQVEIYPEMVDLFNPDNFNCGLSDKLKDKIKESKRKGTNVSGYVPDVVISNLGKFKTGIRLDDRGANALVHRFTFEQKDNKESETIVAKNTPTQLNFNSSSLIDNQNDNYSSFTFTMDCSGYFSASAKVSASGGFLGFGKGSATVEGENMINRNQSILIIRALIYSPLYAAYDGSYLYATNEVMDNKIKREILKNRVLTLQGILNAVPIEDQLNDKRVFLSQNYEVIITSNKGNSGYNGSGRLNADVQLNYGVVQTSGNTSATNSVSRKSDYSTYTTYILKQNVDAIPAKITFKNINDRILEINGVIAQL